MLILIRSGCALKDQVYFIENVYHKLDDALPAPMITEIIDDALAQGQITKKETALWRFGFSAYGGAAFSAI